MTSRRWLRVTAIVEAVSLVVLLVNLATVHLSGVAALVGPIHGTAYLAGIALAWSAALPVRARFLACIPAVGAALALRTTAVPNRRPHSEEFQ